MKMNNKGFAVSTILYGVLVIFFLVVALLMSILSTNRKVTTELVDQIDRELNDYSDSVGNKPNPPKLVSGMIPIKYNSEGKKWVKSAENDEAWYDYYNQQWANVALVKEAVRTTYQNASIGTEVKIDDIIVMLVWIPRFSYTKKNQFGYSINGNDTLNATTPGAFNIKFVDSTITDTGSASYDSEDALNSSYYTPSSFCWGNSCDKKETRSASENTELSGFWVSKFELGVNSENKASCAAGAGDCDNSDIIPYSIPNITSWRNAKAYTFYTAIKKSEKTKYGLSGTFDMHMIKNTEWGEVAALSQSKYGKYGKYLREGKTITEAEIAINNCSNYTTGIAGNSVSAEESSSCNNKYDSEKGQTASTTGTVYGVYDMSGGAWEVTMGHYGKISDDDKTTSGFTTLTAPESKYYNIYDGSEGILGDMTRKDTMTFLNGTWKNPYYGDYSSYPTIRAWLVRGGKTNLKAESGVFAFNLNDGTVGNTVGTRLSLIVN